MMLQSLQERSPSGMCLAISLGLSILLSSCAEDQITVRADGCWGAGVGADSIACLGEKAGPMAALGFDLGSTVINANSVLAASGKSCGALVDCSALQAAPPPVASMPTKARNAPITSASAPVPVAPGAAGSAVSASSAGGAASGLSGSASAAQPEAPAPAGAGEEVAALVAPKSSPSSAAAEAPVVSGKASTNCVGISVSGMEKKSSLSAKEISCAMDTAKGTTNASDAEVQTAAIALYNTKSGGWPSAVEAALGRSNLSNAPPLNFAGLKPAYDKSRFGTVLQRSRKVWRNLGKGYQLSGSDKDFLVEYSCRAAGQLALAGKPPGDGLDWCERWLDRAERKGSAVEEIEDLIRQLE